MRAPCLYALAFLLAASVNLFAQGTTTASVCHNASDPGCLGPFNGMTFVGTDGSTINISADNADSTPRELSTVPIQPSGSTLQVFVELQPWFHADQGATNYPIACTASGCTSNNYVEFDNHVEVGYDSFTANTVQRQLNDMLTRSLNGVVIDWYSQFGDATENAGPGNMEDMTAQAIRTAFSTNPFCNSGNTLCLHYAIQEDQGAWKRTNDPVNLPGCVTGATQPDQTLCIERQLERDFAYLQAQYLPSTGYLNISSQHLIQFFVDDGTSDTTWNANWTTVWQREYNNGKNLGASLVFKGKDAFTHYGGLTDGAFAWPAFNGGPDPDNTLNAGTVLPNFYNTAASHTNLQIWGVTYKGFDERTDQSRPGASRYIKQKCGQVWLQTVQALRNPATLPGGPAGLAVPFGLVSTWNDYGEGTSIEPGIDNCVSAVNGSDGGCDVNHQCTLNWNTVFSDTTNGTEHTLADFRIDEVNMITGVQNVGIATITPDANGNFQTHSFTYPDTEFGCDEWFYVNAIGLNSVTNHKSNSVDVHCSSGSAQINGAVQSYWTSDIECSLWEYDPDGSSVCLRWHDYGYWTYDSGTVTVSAMGLSKTVSYGGSSSSQSIAAAVANAFNADSSSQVQGTVNGAVVSFRSKHLGPTYNQPLGSTWTWDSSDFSSPSFTVSTSGLQGGAG